MGARDNVSPKQDHSGRLHGIQERFNVRRNVCSVEADYKQLTNLPANFAAAVDALSQFPSLAPRVSLELLAALAGSNPLDESDQALAAKAA